jgi:hypothetical protein
MSHRLAPIHNRFPKEMAIVGRLLSDYSEIELGLMNCVQAVRDFDLDTTLKTMFRIRGETARINVADALARQSYVALALTEEYEETLRAVRYSLKIRNKFSHSYWHNPSDGLCYISLEDVANTDEPVRELLSAAFFYLDEALLLRHEEYFRYTEDLLTFLSFEGRFRARSLRFNPFRYPDVLERPPLYTRKVDNKPP